MRRLVVAALACSVVISAAVEVRAQSDGYALTGLNFNFTNPGARARGIGGAFVAIADDSTAALANPAGIAFLAQELTLEVAYDEERFPVGQLTQGGVDREVALPVFTYTAVNDPFRERAGSSETRVNYASVILPVVHNRMTVAVYYATLADMETSFAVGTGVVCVDSDGRAFLPGAGEQCVVDFEAPDSSQHQTPAFGQEVSLRLSTRLFGAALGYRMSDRLSLGISVAAAATGLDAHALIDRSISDNEPSSQVTSVGDLGAMASLGVLYRDDRWGFGASYRSETRHPTYNLWLDDQGRPQADRAFYGELTVPQRLAAGAALFLTDEWVVTAEVDRITYSDVLRRMRAFDSSAVLNADITYRISDATEYHLGAEYSTFVDRRGFSVRLGYWRDTTHLPWVSEPYEDPYNDPWDAQRASESLVRARSDEHVHHFTAGVGLSSGVFRLDAAVDYSERSGTDVLLSGVVYF